MWYYESNGRPFGPVSKETVAEALRNGRISETTLVWREGMVEWKPLVDTELAALAGKAPPPMAADSIANITPIYSGRLLNARVDLSKLEKLFWWWFWLLISSIPFYILAQVFPNETWTVGLTCVYEIPLLASLVLQYILLYRFWNIIQDGFARTTPGKAVGFLFIPFFSFYWLFVAFFGLSKDMNGFIERHFNVNPIVAVRKTHPIISLSFLILSLIQVGFTIILYVQMFSVMFNSFNDPTQLTSFLSQYSIPIMIFYFIYTALQILMYFDFFLTAKGILAAKDERPY
jgi:hypothetical protein